MPRSVVQLCALLPLVPYFQVYLSVAVGFRGFLVLSIVLPCPKVHFQVPLPCSASCRRGVFSAWGLLLRVRLPPLPVGSPDDLGLPVRLLFTLHEAASQREFFPLLGPSPSGVYHFFSRLFLCWRPCQGRSLIPSLAPSWWWPCPLLWWALLTLSRFVLGVPSAVSLRRSRC